MGHFHRLYHENYVLSYVERILQHRKLDFRGLKGQFDAKKANFSGLIPKISYLRPILTFRTYPWLIIMGFAMVFLKLLKSNFLRTRIPPIYITVQFLWPNSYNP